MMPIETVLIGVTYACQCDCVHCGAALSRDSKRKELSSGEIRALIAECLDIQATSVAFFGGEPLLRNDIHALITCARSHGFCTNLDTNGALLTRPFTRKLKTAGLNIIGVSIDSSDPDTHDGLRRKKGLFAKALKGIRHSIAEGIKCYISTYATHENVSNGDLLNVIQLARREKADWIRVCAPFAAGKWISCTENRLTSEERAFVERIADEDPEYIVLEDRNGCPGVQQRLLYISAYGDVQSCCYVPVRFGNIREERLVDIVDRMQHHPMYKRYGKLRNCPMNNDAFRRQFIDPLLTGTK
jgi:MoaA/NifB/PqqE/SkfB family radical SAM enzyme